MEWKPIETAPLYQWILLLDDTWKTWGTGMKLDNGFLLTHSYDSWAKPTHWCLLNEDN